MILVIIIFLFAVIYKFARNLNFYIKLRRYKSIYTDWAKKSAKAKPFAEYELQTVELLKNAGVQDGAVGLTFERLNGKRISVTANLFEVFSTKDSDIISAILYKFDNGIGVYKSRMRESLSLLYWMDLVFLAPKNIMQYIGIDTEKVASKALNALLTFLWWAALTVITFYLDRIKEWAIFLLSRQ